MKKNVKRHIPAALFAGLLNGLLGTGGGVPLYFSLSRTEADKNAYATSSVGILLLSLQTVLLYRGGAVSFATVSPFLLFAAIGGGVLGAALLGRIKTRLLKLIFSLLLLFSGGYLLGKELWHAIF